MTVDKLIPVEASTHVCRQQTDATVCAIQANIDAKKKSVPEGCITLDQFHALFMLRIPDDLTRTHNIAVDVLVNKFVNNLKEALLRRKQTASC